MDMVIFSKKIPAEGETVMGKRSIMVFGGKGANQAIAAKRSGGTVQFITKIGTDLFGENMRDYFQAQGLDTSGVLVDTESPTGLAQIVVSDSGENAIAVAPGANAQLIPADLIPFEDTIQNAKIVLMQLETPIQTVEYIASFVTQRGNGFILNPAPAQILSDTLLKNTWLLTPNVTEAERLTGLAVKDALTAERAAKQLLNKGVQNVIVTLGSKGCVFVNTTETKFYPAFNVNCVDTTAAGDVFNGALATSLSRGHAFDAAIPFATAAAAIAVTQEGAQPSIPVLHEITTFLSHHSN